MKAKKGLCLWALLIVTLIFTQSVFGVVADFETLSPGSTCYVGNSFSVPGLTMTGEEFFWSGGGSTTAGFATVGNSGLAGGAGNEIVFNNINLNFDFGMPVDGLSFQFGYMGGDINLTINDEPVIVVPDIGLIPPMVGGTSVFIVGPGYGPVVNLIIPEEHGAMFIMGRINSFKIGGQEFTIDNLIACVVPEPTSLLLLGIGGLMILRRKRRNV